MSYFFNFFNSQLVLLTLLAICNAATIEIIIDMLNEIPSYLIFANATSAGVHSQYSELRVAFRFRIFCIFQYNAWNRITLLNAYYSVNALKASITR